MGCDAAPLGRVMIASFHIQSKARTGQLKRYTSASISAAGTLAFGGQNIAGSNKSCLATISPPVPHRLTNRARYHRIILQFQVPIVPTPTADHVEAIKMTFPVIHVICCNGVQIIGSTKILRNVAAVVTLTATRGFTSDANALPFGGRPCHMNSPTRELCAVRLGPAPI